MKDNPNVVEVEFTLSQIEFLENVKTKLKQPSIASVLRILVDNVIPAYESELRLQEMKA